MAVRGDYWQATWKQRIALVGEGERRKMTVMVGEGEMTVVVGEGEMTVVVKEGE